MLEKYICLNLGTINHDMNKSLVEVYRQCSHKLLPFNQRNITIYNYVAISNELENNRIDDKGQPMNDIDLKKSNFQIKKWMLLIN